MPIPFVKLLAASFSLLLLQGCGGPKLEAIPANGTILAFGDSLTAGYGVDEAQSYPSVLAELSDRTVINAGISGETTAEGLARLPSVLDQTQPDLAESQEIEVVLVGVPSRLAKVAPFYKDLAQEHDLIFAPELVGSLLREDQYKSDEVHFNALGYRIMAEELHERLQENGAF